MLRSLAFTMLCAFGLSTNALACEGKYNGFYIGADVGYGTGDFEFAATDGSRLDLEGDGATVGGHIGYNYQCSAFVYGIEGDMSWSGIKDDISANGATLEAETNYLASIRGRVGYDTGAALLFATAGIGFTDTEYTLNVTGVGNLNVSETATGFVFGGGVESMLSETISMRFEVLHYRFGEVYEETAANGITGTIEHNPTVFRIGGSMHLN